MQVPSGDAGKSLGRKEIGGQRVRDPVLERLQGKAFNLPDPVVAGLEDVYADGMSFVDDKLSSKSFEVNDAAKALIEAHREQLRSEEYIRSRIEHPDTGTLDHIHAEVTAKIAYRLACEAGLGSVAAGLALVAGHLHDDDRSFPALMTQGEQEARSDPQAYKEFKQRHMVNSARRVRDIGQKVRGQGTAVPQEFLDDICYLVGHHELGGERTPSGTLQFKPAAIDPSVNLNAVTDVVKDADSAAFFAANIITYWDECGEDPNKFAAKIHYMFDRMSPEVREMVRDEILYGNEFFLSRDLRGEKYEKMKNILYRCIDERLPKIRYKEFIKQLQAQGVESAWQITQRLPLKFRTYHPQGLVKVGDDYYLTAAQIEEKPVNTPSGRTTGKGKAHLFHFNAKGELLDDLVFGEDSIYHPGGIDYDGRFIWVSIAEYRPHSRSIIYRLDPQTMRLQEMFRVADHIGALAFNKEKNVLIGATWDGNEFYEWTPEGTEVAHWSRENVDLKYQDMKFVGGNMVLASGMTPAEDGGGLDLIDIQDRKIVARIPLNLRGEKQEFLTRNPMTFRFPSGKRLQFFFVPEDDDSVMYTLEPVN